MEYNEKKKKTKKNPKKEKPKVKLGTRCLRSNTENGGHQQITKTAATKNEPTLKRNNKLQKTRDNKNRRPSPRKKAKIKN